MLHRVFLPQLGQTMEEGTIERWHKKEGDQVKKGEVLFELTTDKATLEVEAVAEGVVKKLLVAQGQSVAVNELIAVIGDPEDELTDDILAAEPAPVTASAAEHAPVGGQAAAAPVVAAAASVALQPTPETIFASPRARKVARELSIPVEVLAGSGPGGRVVEQDVLAYGEKLGAVRCTPAAKVAAYEAGVSLVDLAAASPGGRLTKEDVAEAVKTGAGRRAAPAPGQRVPLSPMRHTIAQRMTMSKQTVPHFYLVGDAMMRAAGEYARELTESTGQKITITTLIIKAVGIALKRHPRVNGRFDGDAAVLNAACNVGVAVAVEDGLFVPVVKDADRKGLAQISTELRELAGLARQGKLIPEQYEGGSVTLSNLGMFGVDYFIPIINPPESCIVGIGRIKDEAIVSDGGIRIEPVMKISISADHRIVDGLQTAQFFSTLKELLENPVELGS